ncbi:DNA helicase [Rothia halotolerans]|uniref:DNA helicase n=1 Tax=Rothia halotolerans TaxID=405770 RepID=UPI00101CFAA8|nr:DNA helicase [Rothia halotolerans]
MSDSHSVGTGTSPGGAPDERDAPARRTARPGAPWAGGRADASASLAPSSPGGPGPADSSGTQDAPAEAPEEPAHGAGGGSELRLGRWLEQVEVYTGPDALLDFNRVDNVHIDLTESNPSGYAQLLSGRKTRLSTILRDRAALSTGMRSAQAIRAKTFELDADHGLSAGFFAAGTASWISREERVRAPGQRRGVEKRFIAPILLAPISINPHPDGDDYELRLTGPARLNPGMVRQLRKEYGIDPVAEGVARKAVSGSRLTPEPVLEALRTLCSGVLGMHVEATTVVSTFADLSDTVGQLPTRSAAGILRDLSDLETAEVDGPRTRRGFSHEPAHPDALSPRDEALVYDADSRISEITQLARAGESMTVTAPPGTQLLRAALNVVAALAEQGKSVMVLGERRATLAEAKRRLKELGLADLVLEPGEENDPEELSRSLISSIVDRERSEEPSLEALHRDLVQARERLSEHVESLHWHEERWGVTPYRAMQTLAELTAKDPAPSTRVRFKRAVLDATVDRAETVAQLERAAELRAFHGTTKHSPWFGAKLVNTEETTRARALVREILETARELGERLHSALGSAGLERAETLAGWEEQLDLLEGVEESLERFTPEIFDGPVTDLIAATASSGWRRERGIDMSALQRSKLRRAAKEYIRPQVHLSDVHRCLVTVQEQHEARQRWAVDDRVVSVPEGLAELRRTYDRLSAEVSGLAIVMEDSPARRDYFQTPIRELLRILETMAQDPFLLDTLPERERLLSILRGKGLGELLVDLEQRAVPQRAVADELDLAWWQSAFEIMLTRSEVNLVDGDRLGEWEAVYRRTDAAHVASGPSRVRHGAARGWNRAVNLKPVQARQLRRLLKGAPAPLAEYLEEAPRVLAALRPLWLTSPFAVGRSLPAQARVDAVVVLDAESTPLGACLAAFARADQVIAIGDDASGYPQPFIVSPLLGKEREASGTPVESVLEVLDRIYPSRTLERVHDCRDRVLLEYLNEEFYDGALRSMPYGEEVVDSVRSLRVDYLHAEQPDDHLGAPVVESPAAEVRAVVGMIFDHAARNPRQSLAVLTAGPRHAARIAEGVRYGIGRHPELAEFFAPRSEPFRVLDLARARGVRRDRVILSLGVAPEAGGRADHFGQLADSRGRQRFVMAMTAARFHTRVVSSLTLEQLRACDLRTGTADLVGLLERYEAARQAESSGGPAEPGRLGGGEDPLAGDRSASRFLSVYDPDEREQQADWLLADLAGRLRIRGAQVGLSPELEVDAVATAPGESLSAGAIPSPRARTSGQGTRGPRETAEPLRFPVAVTSDGTEEYARMTVRERSRLLPELLMRTGWNHTPVWTVDVFSDPQGVAEGILRTLGVDPGAAAEAGPGSHDAERGRLASGGRAAAEAPGPHEGA